MGVQVVLIRPGATVYDEQQRLQGNLDLPLSPRGEQEAKVLAARLEPSGMTALYFGHGASLRQTAEIVGRAADVRPKCLDELRNLDQGLWQGLQLEEIRRRNLKLFRQWLEDPMTICAPEGESFGEALTRVRSALKPLWRRHRGQLIGLVVGEPLAQVVSAYLRGNARPHLEDAMRTGLYERIEVAPEIESNGNLVRKPSAG